MAGKRKTGAPKTKAPGPERVKRGVKPKAPPRHIPKDRPPGVKVPGRGPADRKPDAPARDL
jgi:hypothetical protein